MPAHSSAPCPIPKPARSSAPGPIPKPAPMMDLAESRFRAFVDRVAAATRDSDVSQSTRQEEMQDIKAIDQILIRYNLKKDNWGDHTGRRPFREIRRSLQQLQRWRSLQQLQRWKWPAAGARIMHADQRQRFKNMPNFGRPAPSSESHRPPTGRVYRPHEIPTQMQDWRWLVLSFLSFMGLYAIGFYGGLAVYKLVSWLLAAGLAMGPTIGNALQSSEWVSYSWT